MKKTILLLSALLFSISALRAQDTIGVDTTKAYTIVEQMPQFPGGIDTLNKYLMHYVDLYDSNRIGTVYINFTITKTGDVMNARVIMGMKKAPENDSIALNSINHMPKWIPGRQYGKAVNVICNLPVHFMKVEYAIKHPVDPNRFNYLVNNGDTIYTNPQTMPKLQHRSLYDYVNEHIEYPAQEMNDHIEGNVTIRFIVEKDGSISHVFAIREVNDGPGLTREAIRVIFTMPNWEPGTCNGRPVRVQMTFTIGFSLTDNRFLKYSDKDSMYADRIHKYTDTVYDPPQVLPEFIGEMYKYIRKNLEIPIQESREDHTGTIQIGFIVEKDGSLNKVKILQGIPNGRKNGFEASALAVVASMPKWKPGMQNGKPVRSRYFIFIHFRKGMVQLIK